MLSITFLCTTHIIIIRIIWLELWCIQNLIICTITISYINNLYIVLLLNFVYIIERIYSYSSSLCTKLFIIAYFLIDLRHVFIIGDIFTAELFKMFILFLRTEFVWFYWSGVYIATDARYFFNGNIDSLPYVIYNFFLLFYAFFNDNLGYDNKIMFYLSLNDLRIN